MTGINRRGPTLENPCPGLWIRYVSTGLDIAMLYNVLLLSIAYYHDLVGVHDFIFLNTENLIIKDL